MDLPAQLKHETRSAHARLESRLPIMKDSFTRSDYVALLRRFHGFYLPFETRILASRFSPLLEDRRKVPALRDDLTALGMDVGDMGAEACAPIEDVQRPEDLWGALYVLEGSTLGGQIIARRLSARFGLSGNNGLSFFSGHGPATARRWKAFLSAMEGEHGKGNLDEARTVQSAVKTFETLETWLIT